jgi:hypothetical protein
MRTPHTRHAREGGHPVRREAAVDWERFGMLDHPLEPVIGLAKGETRWQMMTAELEKILMWQPMAIFEC